VSVVSIGHISTTALAAISLGSMTANVSGYTVILGLTSALDTVLPSAWTSNQPQLVGLWAQRMSQSIKSLDCIMPTDSESVIITAVVVFVSLAVSLRLVKNLPPTDSVPQPMFLIWLNAESILSFLNQEPEVAHLAAIYLRWASLGLPGRF
jgi:MATE family multidrug resistance protein